MNALNSSLVFLLKFLESFQDARVEIVTRYFDQIISENARNVLSDPEGLLNSLEMSFPIIPFRENVSQFQSTMMKALMFNQQYQGGPSGFRRLTANVFLELTPGDVHRYDPSLKRLSLNVAYIRSHKEGEGPIYDMLSELSRGAWSTAFLSDEDLLEDLTLKETKHRLMRFFMGKDQIRNFPYDRIEDVK